MEELQEAKDKCEYPPRLQILYTRKDKSTNLDYRFHVEKMENEKSEIIAIFPLMKTAIGNMHIIIQRLLKTPQLHLYFSTTTVGNLHIAMYIYISIFPKICGSMT